MITATSHVSTRGSLFNGSLARAIDDFTDDFEREFSQHAHDLIQARLRRVLKNPTGYYQSQVVTSRRLGDWAVTDSGVIYGPWLEGTGSRNRTTRFKGYFTFRIVTQRLQREAEPFAERILRRKLGAV